MGPHSHFPGAVISRTIFAVLALIITTQAYAQGDLAPSSDPDTPFAEAYNSGYSYRGTAIRMSYKSSAYGLSNDRFSLGLQNRRHTGDGVLMLDGQYGVSMEENGIMGLNVGLGRRWLYQSSFSETARIFGTSVWYDGANTELRNMLNQVGVSVESLGEMWDFRFNANLPLGTTRQDGNGISTGETFYSGYYLSEMTNIPIDQAVGVLDFEVARRIGHDNVWVWAGGYSLWEDDTDESTFGGKAGVRGYVYDDLLLQLAVTSDEMFDTKVTFNLIWYPGRSSRQHRARHDIDDRLMEPVIRNNYIALRRDHKGGGDPLTYEDDGEEIRIVHVDSNAAGAGDGTFESPFTSLDSVNGGSQDRDIVLVHSGTAYSGQHAVLRDNQRLLGEGNDIRHYVDVRNTGQTALPATSDGALAAAIPQISNTVGDAITLGSAETTRQYDDSSTTSTNEVNNLAIVGGTQGIVSSAVGIGQTTIKNVAIADTTGHGIALTEFEETVVQADSSTDERVLFSPTIDTVALTNIGGDGINLDATTTESDVTEKISLANITSTNGTGRGISITGNQKQATIEDYGYDGGTTATGGILFADSEGGASIKDTTITGAGTGISIVENTAGDSTGYFGITDTTITDTLGAALHINGGLADVNFAGKIDQNENAAAVSIEGGHTGRADFGEAETDAGVIAATAGSGLLFNGADGTYNFNHAVELSGTSGIDVDSSDGTITFSDATVDNSSIVALNINGGAANVNFTGLITQTVNNVAAVNVAGDHTGTVNLYEAETDAGVVVASAGPGLTFTDADGSYNFNHAVEFSGTSVVDIDGSDGMFMFASSSSIDSGSGTAFTIRNGEASVTYSGTIDSTGGRPVEIIGNSAGLVMFTGTIDGDDNGILVDDNTGGTFQFMGLVDLDMTGSNIGIDFTDNDSATIAFSNLNVTTIDGVGFNAVGDPTAVPVEDGGYVQLTGSNNIIETTGTGIGINMSDVQIAASGAAFKSVSVDGAASGIVLSDVTGSGTFYVGSGGSNAGDGGSILNTTGVGVSITNTANTSLNYMLVDETTGHGVSLVHNNGTAFNVSVNNSTIRNTDNTTNGAGINLAATGTGVMTLALDGNTLDNTGLQGINLDVGDGAGTANITANNNNVTNASGHEALLLTVSGASAKTVNFAANDNSFTNNSTDSAFSIQADGAVTLNATVHGNNFGNGDAATGRALEISGNNSAAAIRLSLLDNVASVGNSNSPFLLNKTAGSFGVVLLETPAGTVDVPKVDEVNRRNGGSGTYADYAAPANTPADAGWVIEFLPDAAAPPLTAPMDLGFSNLNEGDVPTP